MFGPALMVSPVTTYQARARAVVPARRPRAAGTTSGPERPCAAESECRRAAPFDAIPVHVRAGAIIPFGPELQYTDEKPADPITVYVYAGSDGAFTLYEDDGVSHGYEKGAFATIPLRWQDATRTLTIGKRAGAFPGMLARRTFQVVLVRRDRPVPFSFNPKPERTVGYAGEAVTLKL